MTPQTTKNCRQRGAVLPNRRQADGCLSSAGGGGFASAKPEVDDHSVFYHPGLKPGATICFVPPELRCCDYSWRRF